MGNMFHNAINFNQDISGWNTTRVTYFVGMFFGCAVFNQDLSGWITSSVTNMASMFRGATAFNSVISGWDTSSVRQMGQMVNNANAFSYTNACMCLWELMVDASVLAGLSSQTCSFTTLNDAQSAHSQSAEVVRTQADQIADLLATSASRADHIADLLAASSTLKLSCRN